MTERVVISVQQAYYKYPTSTDWVLRGPSVEIRQGEFLGLVGTTGAGKTTLCQTFNGLIPHYTQGTFEGAVLVHGQDTRQSDIAELSTIVGLVFQDADAQLVMSTVLEEMQIAHLADRPPYALSGGQKQRAAIAAVMAMEPEVLVLDEATSELDSLTVHRIFEICRQLNQQGKTIVLVSHEMELLSSYATRLILLDGGEIILEGPPDQVFTQAETCQRVGVRLPQVSELAVALGGRRSFESLPLSIEETIEGVLRLPGSAN